MIEIARWSVSTTSTSSASDNSFASLALLAFAAVNFESDDVLGCLVLAVRGLGCSFSLEVFPIVLLSWAWSQPLWFALLLALLFCLLLAMLFCLMLTTLFSVIFIISPDR